MRPVWLLHLLFVGFIVSALSGAHGGLCAAAVQAADAEPTPVPAPVPAPKDPKQPTQPTPPEIPGADKEPDAEPDAAPPPAVQPFESGHSAHASAPHTGAVELSSGETLRGALALTEGRTIRLFDLKSKTYHDITFDNLKSIEVKVEFEKKAEEWAFKEGGNDEKILTGNWYIDRRYQVRCTPFDGAPVTGYVLGTVFYLVDVKQVKHRFFLHKDERGENKQEAKDVVYVVKVTVDAPATAPATPPLAPAGDPHQPPAPRPNTSPTPPASGAPTTPDTPPAQPTESTVPPAPQEKTQP